MNTEENNQDGTPTGNEGGEGEGHVAENDSPTAEEVAALKEKAAKAEALEKELGSTKRDLKKLNKQLDEVKSSVNPQDTPDKTTQQSDEPDYGKIALLEAKQINHPDDQKVVMDEAARLKLPLTDILQMEHIKSKLEAQQNERTTKDGMPDGSGRKGNATKNDVDYYLEHPDEHPEDIELANKVIDARLKQESNSNKFSPDLYVG